MKTVTTGYPPSDDMAEVPNHWVPELWVMVYFNCSKHVLGGCAGISGSVCLSDSLGVILERLLHREMTRKDSVECNYSDPSFDAEGLSHATRRIQVRGNCSNQALHPQNHLEA